jgi:hypothetical protein
MKGSFISFLFRIKKFVKNDLTTYPSDNVIATWKLLVACVCEDNDFPFENVI